MDGLAQLVVAAAAPDVQETAETVPAAGHCHCPCPEPQPDSGAQESWAVMLIGGGQNGVLWTAVLH